MSGNDENRHGGICIVGPVLPYRGGIAHYNSMLFRTLREIDAEQTCMFSFSRQYPRFLYPGKGDRDTYLGNYQEDGVEYTIDSMNPWTWWKTARQISRKTPALVVFHWWTVFWAPCFITMAYLLRRRGIRIALICHNLVDHDAGSLKKIISQWALSAADAYMVHSSDHQRILERAWPTKQVVWHPIPVYGHYPPARQLLPKRGRLELLFFGFIRPYKGLDVLIEAIDLLNDSDVHLTIIGEYWGDTAALSGQIKRYSNIEGHLDYMSDAEAAQYFERADFVVLPYRSATGSAVASVAFHYAKPIIASRTGGLPDVVIEGRTGKLVAPGDAKALADVIRGTDRAEAGVLSEGVKGFKDSNNWYSLCRLLLSLSRSKRICRQG